MSLIIFIKKKISLSGIKENSFYDLEKTFNLIKENIYSIEQKFITVIPLMR